MATPSLETGALLAEKYRVLRVLGEGGMGTVYEAEHVALGERVAIKVLHPALADRPEVVERFVREARSALRIKSEHVARVNDVGTLASGAPFMVLEMLDGSDLGAMLDESGPLPTESAVAYVLQACEAIAEAHAIGIVHRDIKPANIFVTNRVGGQPLVKVLDFGIAKALTDDPDKPRLTSSSASIGSPMYMSPEQIRDSREADPRSDVWSLGVTLFELVSGKVPFPAEGVHSALAKIMTEPPLALSEVAPSTPPELSKVISRALEKDPAKRYPTVAHLAFALLPFAPSSKRHAERARDALGVREPTASLAATASISPPSRPNSKTRTTLLAVIGLTALGALAVLAWWPRSTGSAPAPATLPAPVVSATPERSSAPPRESVEVAPAVAPSASASQAPAKSAAPRVVPRTAPTSDKGFDARKF